MPLIGSDLIRSHRRAEIRCPTHYIVHIEPATRCFPMRSQNPAKVIFIVADDAQASRAAGNDGGQNYVVYILATTAVKSAQRAKVQI